MPHFSVTIDAYYISMSILLNIKISDFQKKKLGILYLTYLPTYLPTSLPPYLPTYQWLVTFKAISFRVYPNLVKL